MRVMVCYLLESVFEVSHTYVQLVCFFVDGSSQIINFTRAGSVFVLFTNRCSGKTWHMPTGGDSGVRVPGFKSQSSYLQLGDFC